jgi:cell division transport system permease protein
MKWTTLKISLLFIITLSQIMILAGFLSYKNLNTVLGSWNNAAHLSIYLQTDILDDERSAIETKIRKNANVEKVEFIDREKAAKDFQKSFGAYSAGLLSVDELVDIVPEAFVVSLKNELSLLQKMSVFDDIILETKTLTGIDEVSFGGEWLKKFSKLDQTLKSVGLFILAIVLLSVSFMSALMVRILIDDAKPELEVYSLIGATRWFTYKIFLREMLAFTMLSLVLTFISLLGIFAYLKNVYLSKNMNLAFAERLTFLSPSEIIIFCVLVSIFIFVSSFIALKTTIQRLNQFSYD